MAISNRHTPGSFLGGVARNVLVEAWGQLVGRRRALAEFDYCVSDAGSLTAAARNLSATPKTLKRWRAAFDQLPDDSGEPHGLQGQTIGGWYLVRRLGGGGNGEVWQGRRGHASAAVKILRRAKGAALQRFRDEIAAQKRLSDVPGVLPILDSFLDASDGSDRAWLATPVAAPLGEALKEGLPEAVACVSSIATTLVTVHARGFAHRDVKPENIFLRNGNWELGDFGLVHFPGKTATTRGAKKLGPMHFIAPEMLNAPDGADGCAADVYSLAKCLWVLATRQRFPLPGQLQRRIPRMRLSTFAGDLRAYPLDELLDRATHFDPSKRPSMEEFAETIGAWRGGRDAIAPARPRRRTQGELANVGVQLTDPSRNIFHCVLCGVGWAVNLRPGGRLPRGYWKCPQGCNGE